MRIAIDCRPLMAGNTSGVETYMHNLMHALFQLDQKNEYILWYNNWKTVNTDHFPQDYPNVVIRRTRIPNKLLNLSQSVLRWPAIDHLLGVKIDLLWVPDPRPAPVGKKVKKVITFHDLSFREFSYGFSLKSRLWHLVLRPKKEAKEANHLISVSQFTKDQLKDAYHIPDKKITVIQEAAASHLHPGRVPKLFEVIKRKYDLPDHYILALSTIEPRKNTQRVIQAFSEWQRRTSSDIHLVVAGKTHDSIFRSVSFDKGNPHIVFPGFIQEEDKAALYQHAVCFLYPSLYEGFGLPILEAMQCGTPVITSDVTGTKETAGGAAYLVNPTNVMEIGQAIHEVIHNQPFQDELREKGLRRAKEFSWKKAAEKTLMVLLKEALGS